MALSDKNFTIFFLCQGFTNKVSFYGELPLRFSKCSPIYHFEAGMALSDAYISCQISCRIPEFGWCWRGGGGGKLSKMVN